VSQVHDFNKEKDMTETLIAVFGNARSAENAVQDLLNAGFSAEDISFAVNDTRRANINPEVNELHDVSAGEGAGVGALFGSIVGAVATVATLTIPGIGPVLAAGPLQALIAAGLGAGIGAATGAVTGGITAGLVKLGVPEEDASLYAESLRRGDAIVTVMTDDSNLYEARRILSRHSPVDLDQRRQTWEQSGWQRFNPDAQPLTDVELADERRRYTDINQPLPTGVSDGDISTDRLPDEVAQEGTDDPEDYHRRRMRSYPYMNNG
jgi:uncharacterized membrane protein